MIESKHLEFYMIAMLLRTNVWSVISKTRQNKLGEIKWYGGWRQYAFFPCTGTIWNKACLAEIQSFLQEIKR